MTQATQTDEGRYQAAPAWWIGAAAAGLAVLAYLATMGVTAFPGRSVDLLVQYTGVKGTQPLLNPLYEGVARVAAAIPLGTLPLRLALVSMASAWGVLTLLFGLMASATYRTIEEETPPRLRWRAALIAGLGAVAFLAFSKPFWYAANRADYACFHLLLLLAVARLFIAWLCRPERIWLIFVFAFAYGIGMAEFATFLVFGPLFFLTVLVLLALQGRFSSVKVMGLVLAGLAGMSLYVLAAWRYAGSPNALQPVSGMGEALVLLAKAQFNQVLRSLPTVGWLMVGITTFVPWLILLPLHRRGLRHETGWSFIGLHAIFTILLAALAMDFNLSPWRLLGEGGLLVTPYVCAAMVFGYLAAFWLLEARNPWPQNKSQALERVRIWLCRAMLAVLALTAGTAAVRNAAGSNVRQARVFSLMADRVLTSMGERRWLLTDGTLDNHIRLAARDRGKDVRLMDLSRSDDRRQMRELADEFESPRLKNQAELGLIPFLQEWLRTDPLADRKLALMFLPDLWYGADRVPTPDGLIFVGHEEAGSVDLAALRARNVEFWTRAVAMKPERMSGAAHGVWRHYNRHMSLLANNMGVLLEDNGWPVEAYDAYALSRTIESNNLSALLNQYAMLQGGYEGGDPAAVSNALAEAEVGMMDNFQVWNLARFYGYVRMPEAFAGMGWTWALSGHPGLAVTGLKRALALSRDAAVNENVDMALAAIYMSQNLPEESQKIYARILDRDRTDVRALMGMAELALRWRKPDEARAYIERAEAAGASRGEVAQSWALYHMAIGESAKARVFLEELVSVYTGMTTPWHMLANVLLSLKDERGLERMAKQVRDLPRQDFHTSRALAVAAAARNDGPAMRAHLEQALLFKPRDPSTLDLLIRMDMKEGRDELAERHAKELLRARPDHAFANYILGTMQMKRRDYALAEDSLKRSLSERRTPETLNDLAWAVLMGGRTDEAEILVREALQRNDQLAAAWDTLGMALYRQGKMKDAREAFQKALQIMPDITEFQLHLALVEAAEENWAAAEDLTGKVRLRADRLWTEDRELFNDLSKRVRESIRK